MNEVIIEVTKKIDNHFDEIKIGNILLGLWGYEARYPEFYWVINKANGYVTLRPLKKVFVKSDGNYFDNSQWYTTNGESSGEKSFRRKIKSYGSGNQVHSYVSISSYQTASLWDGSVQEQYNYH